MNLQTEILGIRRYDIGLQHVAALFAWITFTYTRESEPHVLKSVFVDRHCLVMAKQRDADLWHCLDC